MAERQWFGFKYQKEFCQKNNLIENKNYTDKFDTKIKNLGCQIKTYKNNCELMMADPFRYLKNKEDFILVVANRNDKDEIISERKILIKNNKLQSFLKNKILNLGLIIVKVYWILYQMTLQMKEINQLIVLILLKTNKFFTRSKYAKLDK